MTHSQTAPQPVIQLDHIKKVFLTDEVETHALAEINLSVKRGEYVCISGPSGCGKSTLLSILGLLDSPSDGSYTLNGHAVANLDHAERARIRNRGVGFIFQSFNLIGDLTVFENVELPLTYRGMTGEERRERAKEALERVGMSHRAKHYPCQLSGGQQQRVAVARALGGKPAILLADEPTGNLDSENSRRLLAIFRSLFGKGDYTLIVATHSPQVAKIGPRKLVIRDGMVVDESHRKDDLPVPLARASA